MKKFSILLATLAIILAGCSKDEAAESSVAFVKGQKVTLTASVEQPATRAKTNFDGSSIKTAWELNDVALLTVGGKSANFTVKSIDGSGNATLDGTMPESGTTFDLQYPASTPDLTTQEYTEGEALPKDKMLYKATGCSLSAPASLAAQYAVLNVNFCGGGTEVGKIKVTKESTETFTLNFSTSKQLSSSTTPLFMIMPTGTYNFTVEVYDGSATPNLITSFTTSTPQKFSTGEFLNMPAKAIYECVDLGLSVKWATCNVGASKPEDYGDYFAWGETTGYNSGKTNFSWSTYKLCNGSHTTMTKYCTKSACGTIDNKTVLESADDAATVNWGGDWRMPTSVELQELIDNCRWTWTNVSGVKGYKVTSNKSGYEGKSIFLPAAGYRYDTSLSQAGSYGYYWSSSLDTDNTFNASDLYFASNGRLMGGHNRYYGRSVRPVKVEKQEHEYVDLGLSVKWATCNVGASKPEDYGDYFAWGETTGYNSGKTNFGWSTYKWCNGSVRSMTKYCTTSTYGTIDNKTVLEPADDAATANWGGDWRMPTSAELQELKDNCTWTWTQEYGVNGYWVTSNKSGYTDKSIFLPAAGYRDGMNLIDAGSSGRYWSSLLFSGYSSDAPYLFFNSTSRNMYNNYRSYGQSVRPVR